MSTGDQTSSVMNEAELLVAGKRQFQRQKLIKDAPKNWDHFYKRHGVTFFKDRHWTQREFADLMPEIQWESTPLKILEAGCGVGNLIFPLLECYPLLTAYVCDFSPQAIQLVKSHPQYDSSRLTAFVCDLTEDQIHQNIAESSLDLITLIFVLSAVTPEKFTSVLLNLRRLLKVGGSVVFRDYGYNDYAMLRFGQSSRLGEKSFVRQDSTFSYFFSIDETVELFTSAGFASPTGSVSYVHRVTINKKENLTVPRVFIQGRFVRTT